MDGLGKRLLIVFEQKQVFRTFYFGTLSFRGILEKVLRGYQPVGYFFVYSVEDGSMIFHTALHSDEQDAVGVH
jgi:hypothetical protein